MTTDTEALRGELDDSLGCFAVENTGRDDPLFLDRREQLRGAGSGFEKPPRTCIFVEPRLGHRGQ